MPTAGDRNNPADVKLLPDPASAGGGSGTRGVGGGVGSGAVMGTGVSGLVAAVVPAAGAAAPAAGASAAEVERVVGQPPPRQLGELPRDELATLAEEFGLDPTRFKDQPALVAAIHDRRQVIASFDRDAMLDVVRWGRRPVTFNASKEQLAQEIARIRSMRFAGLSARGLGVLARMRGIDCGGDEPVPELIKRLRKQEGFFARLNRKRRSVIAGVVANLVGEADSTHEYQFLPGPGGAGGGDGRGGQASARGDAVAGSGQPSIKHEIEEAGLFGGISNRLKKTADGYINQKLDEIEARIDRKLDEIDRRLAEWRDKEVANRIKILKITLWASVIVGIVSLIYSYVVVNLYPQTQAGPAIRTRPAPVQPQEPVPLPATAPARPVPTTAPATLPS
jgi:hypothetical protein